MLLRRAWFRKSVANRRDRHICSHVCLFIAIVALSAMRASAEVHPVPLDKNTDAAKCLECHDDKTKGKSVHSAMAAGCLSCHEIRVHGNITHVKLITATPAALCITCHADKNAADIKGTVHPPAVRDCLACHIRTPATTRINSSSLSREMQKRTFASAATRPD